MLAENVATFEPPDISVALNLRVPESTKESLEAVIRLWQLLADARGKPSGKIDMSHVCRRLLKVGVEQAFAEVGIKVDDLMNGDVDWDDVEKAVSEVARKAKR